MQKLDKRSFLFIFLTLAAVFLVYSNSFYGDWVFDDPHNIVKRPAIHLERLSIQDIARTFFKVQNGEKHLYRPISCLTFGLNWFFGETIPRGYHFVNLAIHLIASILVFGCIKKLLELIDYKGNLLLISGLAMVLWAIHPIQTQAVSYIVQRMASLAALFYLGGIYFYLHFMANREKRFLAGSLIMFLLAVFSKENAALFPFSIILLEIVNAKTWVYKKRYIVPGLLGTVLLLTAFFLLFNDAIIQGVIEGYSRRPYNMLQRLLTEPRILVFYLYQIFFAPPGSFGFNTPFQVSTTLFSPLSTIFSIIFIVGVVSLSFFLLTAKNKSLKLLGFSVLFYFIHHLVESTILPLELYFEHRNYLPSVFIFLPLALLIAHLLDRYPSRLIYGVVLLSIATAVVAMGLTTYSRNFVWQSRTRFWNEAINNNPESFRPYHNLAHAYDPYAANPVKKDENKAVSLYKTALKKEYRESNKKKSITLYNLAVIYSAKKDYETAESYFKKQIRYLKRKEVKVPSKTYRELAVCMLKMRKIEKALHYINIGCALYPENWNLYRVRGLLLCLLGQREEGLNAYRKGLSLQKRIYTVLWRDFGVALSNAGHFERGLWFLSRYQKHNSSDPVVLFFIVNNLIAQNKLTMAEQYLDQLLSKVSVEQISKMLRKMDEKHGTYYLLSDKDRTTDFVMSRVTKRLQKATPS